MGAPRDDKPIMAAAIHYDRTKDAALVQVLTCLDMDQQIPPELYQAVAEILAFLYAVNDRYRQDR